MIAPSRVYGNWQITQRKPEPQSSLQWGCGWAQAFINETLRDGEVGTAWPPEPYNSDMNAAWQLDSGAPLDHQSCAPRPVARLWTLAACSVPICVVFSSISNYSWRRCPPHWAHWFCFCPLKLILGISMKLVGAGGFTENSNIQHPIKLYLRGEKTLVVFGQLFFVKIHVHEQSGEKTRSETGELNRGQIMKVAI